MSPSLSAEGGSGLICYPPQSLGFFRRMILPANMLKIHRGWGNFMSNPSRCSTTIRAIARFRNHFVVRDDEPGRLLGTASGQDFLVSRRVIVPELSFHVIGLADLPLLGRIVEPFLEATQLLLFGDVQVELEDMGVVLDKSLLERVYLVVSAGPDRLRDQVVDADDEHVLVVGAVEDDHFSFRGEAGEPATGNRGPIPWQ